MTVDEVARPLHPSDFQLITVLGRHLEKVLSFEDPNDYALPPDFAKVLTDLLSHVLVSEARISALLNLMRWHLHDDYVVFAIQEPADSERLSDLLPQLSLSLVREHNYLHFVIFDGRGVFVCNLSSAGLSREDVIAELAPSLRDQLARASFSARFSDFRNLYYFYRQALDAERIGMRLDPTRWLFRYEDYAFQAILDRCLYRNTPEALVPSCLKDLMAYDKRKGRNLTGLLRLYLDSDRNIATTARAAFLHRNTCIKQLKRIEEILRVDLNDPEMRIVLQLALRAYERDAEK